MTQQQKEQITRLRTAGTSFGKIASVLGIFVNTVKSYCKRNPASAENISAPQTVIYANRCPQCNTLLRQTPGHRQERFCSSKCRMAWWKTHPEQMNRKKVVQFECRYCGVTFFQYGSRPRKFCSRDCYLAHRYEQDGDNHG